MTKAFDPKLFLDNGNAWVARDDYVDRYLTAAVTGFQRFLQLPQEEKDRWTFDLSKLITQDHVPDPDDGYRRKDGEEQEEHGGRRADKKEVFHWRPSLQKMAIAEGLDVEPHLKWIFASAKVYNWCATRWLAVASDLEDEYRRRELPPLDIMGRVLAFDHTLRFVAYHKEGGAAQEHTDRAAATMRLYATHPSYRMRGESVAPQAGRFHIFGGDKMAQVTGERSLAMDHSADPVPAQQRIAVVFFGQLNEVGCITLPELGIRR